VIKYTFRFNVEGGDCVELNLDKEQFDKLSELCEKEFPDKDWRTEMVKTIEA
jgi:hypothetical protein